MRLIAPLAIVGTLLACTLSTAAVRVSQVAENPFQRYLPSVFAPSALPSPEDWWNQAEALGYKLKRWTDAELAKARKVAGAGIDAFRQHADGVVIAARHLSMHVAQGEQQAVHDELARALEDTLEEMRAAFPPPEDAPGHEARREAVRRALALAAEKIVEVLRGRIGVDEETLRRDVRAVCAALEPMIVTAGDLVEQHPVLAETFIIVGAALLGALIPEWFILRPLIRVFGFGPLGPVKGSPAAWAQRYFWGAAVAEGSWFAALQRAGMIGVGWLTRVIGAGLGGLIGLAGTWPCFGAR
ncbi:hypothetical protein K488DRAFT_91768 [Vararia minispora EC-137]|uniref:Uncharacterized protein n=1 Tax=Vararia minispora EC-137 TaxID=1314806 RepID=A0ACB8Q527_9AGAM|nr:hypothetical protein K488DRAFT_91768 [Vararia minispora EC-137]